MRHDKYDPALLFDADTGIGGNEGIGNYTAKTCAAGKQLEIHIYPSWSNRKAAGQARQVIESFEEQRKCKEAQRRGDANRARQKLCRITDGNFTENVDWKTGLDYEIEPKTPEEADKHIQTFLRKARKEYKKLGKELKYIYVTQSKTPTGRPRKRIHHHLVITSCGDMSILRKLWPHGRIHIDILQPDANGLMGLATYLSEHAHVSKRWVGSKNLVIPKPQKAKGVINKKTTAELEIYENARTYFEDKYPGYKVASIDKYYSSYVPGVYLYVRMRRAVYEPPKQGWMQKLFGRLKQ